MRNEELIKGKSIEEIEKDIQGYIQHETNNQRLKILTLAELKNTNRYRENPIYQKSTFDAYIFGRWGLKRETFDHFVNAYSYYPKITERYDPGVIANVLKKCKDKSPKAMEEIQVLEQKRKKPLNYTDFETVIDKYKKPVPKNETIKPDYEGTIESLRQEVRYWREKATEKTEQNIKLIATVKRQEKEIDRLKKQVNLKNDEIYQKAKETLGKLLERFNAASV